MYEECLLFLYMYIIFLFSSLFTKFLRLIICICVTWIRNQKPQIGQLKISHYNKIRSVIYYTKLNCIPKGLLEMRKKGKHRKKGKFYENCTNHQIVWHNTKKPVYQKFMYIMEYEIYGRTEAQVTYILYGIMNRWKGIRNQRKIVASIHYPFKWI